MAQSRLTKTERKALLDILGCQHLSLLYKASLHTYNVNAFHNKCDSQGPTVVVGYNASGYIFGGFTEQSYASAGKYLFDNNAFMFRLKGKGQEPSILKFPVKNAVEAVLDNSAYGPTFGANTLVFLSESKNSVTTDANTNSYTLSAEDLHGNDQVLLECEVYRVEGLSSILEKPWREMTWTAEKREALMKEIRTYKPCLSAVPQCRVLLVGPVGAGKSSFFNSVNSTFRGYVSSQAAAGSDSTSLTKQYRTYHLKSGSGRTPLPIIFCDTMGLEVQPNAGLDIEDVRSILEGHIPDRYSFNPSCVMSPNMPNYIKSPSPKDRIHCVAFIIDGSKVEILPEKLEEKLKDIRRKANSFGVPQLVILTKVDQICPIVEEDISYVYKSMAVQKQMRLMEAKLGIPLSHIVPVKNYSSELELRNDVDILILMAVRQMLRLAEDYLDDCDDEPPVNRSIKDCYAEP
uniref:TLDc domain-containing protein n=1 Tax=Podarcis muralis TaxID=64176 RepID=A0A670IU22_PODMU